MKTVILGGGISGLSAANTLAEKGGEHAVYEQHEQYGGLCRSFTVEGYTFDTFAHVAFSKEPYVNQMLEEKTPYWIHKPEALNYYHGSWLRNPVQNNLIDLDVEERIKIIKSFIEKQEKKVCNYEDWLRVHYGDYFTEHFPACYTRKYWTVEPDRLEAKWVTGRMYVPNLEEVLRGAMTKDTPNVHYSKEIHYPRQGGYGAFLEPFASKANLFTKKKAVKVDAKEKYITFEDGEKVSYENLISTIPLDQLISCLGEVPGEVREAADKLDYTYGVLVSIGLKKEKSAPSLWFYIYNEDILPARIYAPEIKSPNNVPKGCCALQAEIYFSKYKPRKLSLEEIKEKTVEQLIQMKLFNQDDIACVDVREEKYANIMFTPEIYISRKKVHEYLDSLGIIYAGRFGEWDYLWTDQSIISGKRAAEKILRR